MNKKVLIIILIVLIGLGLFFIMKYQVSLNPNPQNTSQNQEKPWRTFTDPEEKFSVLLPTKPHPTDNGFSTSTDNKTGYFIYVIASEAKQSSPFDTQVQNLLKEASPSAQLIYADQFEDSTDIKFLDYKIINPELEKKGRMFLKDQTVYLLLQSIPKANKNIDDFNQFISSFQLL